MAKRKKSKAAAKRKGQSNKSLFSPLKSWWNEKSPVLQFSLAFALLMGLFYAFYFSSFYQEQLLPYVIGWQSQVASGFLSLFGYGTSVSNTSVITGTNASVNVKGGCDGVEAIALLLVSITCIPLMWKYKWQGMLAGVAVLLFLNMFRIAGLYITRVHWIEAFDFLHLHGGFVIFTLASLLLVIVWASWAMRKQQLTIPKHAE